MESFCLSPTNKQEIITIVKPLKSKVHHDDTTAQAIRCSNETHIKATQSYM